MMSVEDPGRWIRLDPLDKIREEVDDATTGDISMVDDSGVPPPPPLRLETVYGRCSKRERPSMRKSAKQDSMI